MKNDDSKNNKIPWYVRYCYWVEQLFFGKTLKIILILAFIFAFLISYVILKSRPITPYDEFYDIAFKNYINTKLDDISNTVINESSGIELDQIPQTVLEYNISWREEGIEFGYILDTEKIISEYYVETGKFPTSSYSAEEFSMDIQMSKDFKNISKTSSIEPPSKTREEYQQEYPKRMIIDAFNHGVMAIAAILMVSLPILFISFFPALATEWWGGKHEEEYNKLFHKENN